MGETSHFSIKQKGIAWFESSSIHKKMRIKPGKFQGLGKIHGWGVLLESKGEGPGNTQTEHYLHRFAAI